MVLSERKYKLLFSDIIYHKKGKHLFMVRNKFTFDFKHDTFKKGDTVKHFHFTLTSALTLFEQQCACLKSLKEIRYNHLKTYSAYRTAPECYLAVNKKIGKRPNKHKQCGIIMA